MRKRILWVEDKIETIFDMIAEDRLFNQNLDEKDLLEFDKLKNRDIEIKNEFLRKKNILLIQDFCEACEIIFNEENFDIIILDVNFPSPVGDELNSTDILKTKELFVNSCYSQKIKKEFETVFDEIIGLDKYSGIMLFFIICLYYEKERNISEVTKRICIFTQYDINFDDFLNKIYEKISEHSLSELEITKYIKDIERRYWSKTKEEDKDKLKDFIEYDEYAEILKTKIGERASDKFIHLLSKIDSEDPEIITENLGSIRNILENILTNVAENFNTPERCWNKKNTTQIVVKSIIAWINPWNKETNKNNYKYNSNSIIKSFMYGIHDIASDFAAHEDLKDCKEMIKPTGYQPTMNTVNAMIYELKDIILWFDMNM